VHIFFLLVGLLACALNAYVHVDYKGKPMGFSVAFLDVLVMVVAGLCFCMFFVSLPSFD
jgi:hypothetical protein